MALDSAKRSIRQFDNDANRDAREYVARVASRNLHTIDF